MSLAWNIRMNEVNFGFYGLNSRKWELALDISVITIHKYVNLPKTSNTAGRLICCIPGCRIL